ncbi:MAG: hypothetical protein HDT51_03760 [Alistipes sp.]|nr:hypothetical protein [Alistipes sp.]
MKLLKYILPALACAFAATACNDDWGNDNSAMEHVYYYGPEVWGYDDIKIGNNNVVHYEVAQGETVAVPMQFWCEFVRKYDVATYYYVAPKPAGEKYYPNATATAAVAYDGPELVCGTDYEVVDAQGNKLEPNADGAYEMLWPNAKKGVQNIYIKALNGQKGSFNLQTFDPASDVELTNQDVETTIQHKTSDYEVRIFTQNYRVTVTIE